MIGISSDCVIVTNRTEFQNPAFRKIKLPSALGP